MAADPADSQGMTTPAIPTPPAVATPAPAMSLSPAQLMEYRTARKMSAKLRRACGVAATDACFSAIFAALTLACGIIVFSPIGLVMGVGLALVAFNSFRGARRLKRLDPTAPRLLALNQLLLAGVIILYCAYSAWAATHGQGALADLQKQAPELGPDLAQFAGLESTLTLVVYGGVAVGTLIIQGFTGLYYLTRKYYVDEYLSVTPAWVVELQKAEAGG